MAAYMSVIYMYTHTRTHTLLCTCIFMCLFHWQFPLAGLHPFKHSASRFAPSKNHLQTVALRNRKKATDVSLGFLHSNWITQAGAHRQQSCTPCLLEGHSKNSFLYIKKSTRRNVHASKWTQRHVLIHVHKRRPNAGILATGWCMQPSYVLSYNDTNLTTSYLLTIPWFDAEQVIWGTIKKERKKKASIPFVFGSKTLLLNSVKHV